MKKISLKIDAEESVKQKLLESLNDEINRRKGILELLPYIILEISHDGQIKLLYDPDNSYKHILGKYIYDLIKDYDKERWNEWIFSFLENQNSTRLVDLKLSESISSRKLILTLVKKHNIILGTILESTGKKDGIESEFLKTNTYNTYSSEYVKSFLDNFTDYLRTPLNTISLNAQMLLEYSSNITLTVLESHVNKIVNTIEDLNDNLSTLELLPTCKSDYLKGIQCKLTKETYLKKIDQWSEKWGVNINYSTTWEAGDILIMGEEAHFFNLIECLLKNAIQHMRCDVNISFLHQHNPNSTVLIIISDDGEGLSANTANKMFQTGWRKDKQLNRAQKGLGLGLRFVHEYLDAVNGDIDIISNVHKGTKIKVTIPTQV